MRRRKEIGDVYVGRAGMRFFTFLFRLLICSVTVGKCAPSLPRGSIIVVRYGASYNVQSLQLEDLVIGDGWRCTSSRVTLWSRSSTARL